ncbi:hypothetical protein CFP65_0364 [Kitasatospora sp. MMS16-BH015]|uniref:hypothetical protein n=1 Tax=Kitasatospora sp. MMS16-BH015 TaxID=2018025 RepID=UPI000CA17F0E|nr:hypothetical protein [Kitasatospora sp. MMS16-BH015]AUG75334.1 hypothetical protein CFP65_0364 [Kitasatospora sp. MMS16-BH015]
MAEQTTPKAGRRSYFGALTVAAVTVGLLVGCSDDSKQPSLPTPSPPSSTVPSTVPSTPVVPITPTAVTPPSPPTPTPESTPTDLPTLNIPNPDLPNHVPDLPHIPHPHVHL